MSSSSTRSTLAEAPPSSRWGLSALPTAATSVLGLTVSVIGIHLAELLPLVWAITALAVAVVGVVTAELGQVLAARRSAAATIHARKLRDAAIAAHRELSAVRGDRPPSRQRERSVASTRADATRVLVASDR